MDSIETLTVFFGWCSAINAGLLTITSLLLICMRKTISRMHASMFKVSEEGLPAAYFQYMAQYKLAIIVFNLVPYITLKIMA